MIERASIDRSDLEAELAKFREAEPAYDSTSQLDELRSTDYARLDRLGQVYLDYTGGGLYAESQIRQHLTLLSEHVFGNPHSTNPTSMAMTRLVEQTREYILEFFNGSPNEYVVIFTLNATGALKLVGESYPFGPGDQYLLTFDNHNSVNGIREFAKAKGAEITYVPVLPPDLHVDAETLGTAFDRQHANGNNLFAFPAQSNFSGVQHPLGWIDLARSKGWDVLVDCAAFAPTNALDLSRWHPDFVSLSFYKIFGYPTGIGCLIARKAAMARLQRPWYAGGTISFSSVQAALAEGGGFYLTPGSAGFEDGTLNYLGIPAVEIGLKHVRKIGIETIHQRVICLTRWLLEKLAGLRHVNGRQMIQIHGPVSTHGRGGNISMNFFAPDGNLIDCRTIENYASQQNISIRSGCHCNPGAREVALAISEESMVSCFRDKTRMSFEEFQHIIDGKTAGAARVSVGLATTFADIYQYWQFARCFLDKPWSEI